MEQTRNRRDFFRCSLAACGFAAATLSPEEKILLGKQEHPQGGGEQPSDPACDMLPTGKIRHVEMTRLILGGNLIAGIAHARDLRYVSQLLREYFTDEKIIRTWELAEQHGINTMSAWPTPRNVALIERFRRLGGKLGWLGHANCEKPYTGIKTCIDHGADFVHVGMFDFQIAEDCQIARRILSRNLRRDRPWRA